MKLDLLYEIDAPKPWPAEHPYGQRQVEQEAFREAIEQIKLADKMGFNCTWHVEHHFREGRSHSPAPEVLLGALSQVTERIRLGFGVTLLPHPFSHPVRVAEKVATVDILSGGRVEWGTGRSTPMEQTAFGVAADESRAMWEEALQAIPKMWSEEYFEWHGKYLDFPRRMVTPKPFQDPHPPVWAAASSDSSAEIAGELGLGLLTFVSLRPTSDLKRQIDSYRRAASNPRPITDVTQNKVASYGLVHCAETIEQAEENGIWDSVWWWYKNLSDFILEWEFPHFDQATKDRYFPHRAKFAEGNFDPREFDDQDMIIVGDQEKCLQRLKLFADLGVDQFLCYQQFGHLPHESIMKSIQLLGELIPEIEAYEPNPDNVAHITYEEVRTGLHGVKL